MKKIGVFLLSLVLVSLLTVTTSKDIFASNNQLQVLKSDNFVYIRSQFSEKEDLLVRINLGSNNQINFSGTFLIDKSTPMALPALNKGKYIHGNGDDSTPWNLNGTYIGANHGAAVGFDLLSEGHNRTTEDLGTQWEDSKGNKLYLAKISEKNLYFVGENTSKDKIWRMIRRLEGDTLKNSKGDIVKFTEKKLYQVKPACRITKQEYLLNGKTPLKNNEPMFCEWLDVVEEYDIINFGSLLADILAHPGQVRNFVGEHLEGIVSNDITYRFFPNGSTIIYYKSKALQDFRLGYMGFIQSSQLYKGNYQTHEYYIPKTLPFTKNNINYDFKNIQDYSFRFTPPLGFNEKENNVSDLKNLPERFIQFLGNKDGDKTVREVGFALGYSLIHGITVPAKRAFNTDNAITLYTSKKSYPHAISSKMGPMIPTGTEFYCLAYRHYFNPRLAGDATCLYWQRQENDTVVYIDYHKNIDKGVVELPQELVGKKIEIIEKTPSLTLHTKGALTKKGVEISVTDNYGYVVLRIF
ncbi:hypothetical protein M0P98_06440 [bacterium]|nr:hypothetical protein [bacterium]